MTYARQGRCWSDEWVGRKPCTSGLRVSSQHVRRTPHQAARHRASCTPYAARRRAGLDRLRPLAHHERPAVAHRNGTTRGTPAEAWREPAPAVPEPWSWPRGGSAGWCGVRRMSPTGTPGPRTPRGDAGTQRTIEHSCGAAGTRPRAQRLAPAGPSTAPAGRGRLADDRPPRRAVRRVPDGALPTAAVALVPDGGGPGRPRVPPPRPQVHPEVAQQPRTDPVVAPGPGVPSRVVDHVHSREACPSTATGAVPGHRASLAHPGRQRAVRRAGRATGQEPAEAAARQLDR